MNVSCVLENEIKQFWNWFGISNIEYELLEKNNDLEEFMYPNWDKLISLTCDAITALDKGDLSQIQMILEVMALDNEDETILDECEDKLTNPSLETLVKNGVLFPFSNTRWQIAELIGRKEGGQWKQYLVELSSDSNKYVQRRALLSLAIVDPKLSSEIAFQKLDSDDEMLRVVALGILKETSSYLLNDAMKKLEGDSSELVQEELSIIKDSI